MRKVLIISYYYGQTEAIGSVRIRGLAKYLDRFGWSPTVLTVSPEQSVRRVSNTICTPVNPADPFLPHILNIDPDTPFREQLDIPPNGKLTLFLERALKAYKEIVYYPDEQKGWYPHAVAEGSKELEQDDYDAILSSSMPYTSHLIAQELVRRHDIPWVADFRDLWTQNHFFKHSAIRRLFETRLEKRTLSSASAITTVSGPLADKLSALHGRIPVYSIPNGFDPDILNCGSLVSTSFNLVYTGKIYDQRQDPEPLFIAMRDLIDRGLVDPTHVRVDFYGYQDPWVREEVSRYGLENIVFLHAPVSRDASMHLQRTSQILLLLAWNDPAHRGVYTGKVFEYLAAQRPILCIGDNGGVIADLLSTTHAGVNLDDPNSIADRLADWYNEYLSSGYVRYSGKSDAIQQYSHVEMAKKFAGVLDRVIEVG